MKKILNLGILRLVALILILCMVFPLASCGISDAVNDLGRVEIPEDSVAHILSLNETIPEFDKALLYLIETCFRDYYYTDLPESSKLAEDALAAYDEFCRSELEGADTTEITYAIIDCYIYAVGDLYAFYRSADESDEYTTDMSGNYVGIGVSVVRNNVENTILVTSVEIDSPAYGAGIKPDDYIVAVNGERISDIGAEAAVNKIKGEEGTEVKVTILRGEEEIELTMKRAKITETTVAYSFLADGKVGYVQIKSFKSNTASMFVEAIDAIERAGAESVIFDVRSNPGGYLTAATAILSYLVPSGTKIASFSSDKAPIYASHGKGSTFEAEDDHVLKIPSVVLCNETSASAAELFSAAMRDYDDMGILESTIVGNITYKKGIMQSTITFSDKSTLTLTTALYNPPSDINFNGVGVSPDVFLAEGDDYIEAALGILLQ